MRTMSQLIKEDNELAKMHFNKPICEKKSVIFYKQKPVKYAKKRPRIGKMHGEV